MEKVIYKGRTSRDEYGSSRETRLRLDGTCLMAGSRGRALHMSVDRGEDTPWTESFVSDALLDALSRRDGRWFDPRSDEGRRLRRKVEDALRKCNDYTVLSTVAALLDVK
jgi:hypothetical protein